MDETAKTGDKCPQAIKPPSRQHELLPEAMRSKLRTQAQNIARAQIRQRRNSLAHADLIKDRVRARAKSQVYIEAGVAPPPPTALENVADHVAGADNFSDQLALFRRVAQSQMKSTLSQTSSATSKAAPTAQVDSRMLLIWASVKVCQGSVGRLIRLHGLRLRKLTLLSST